MSVVPSERGFDSLIASLETRYAEKAPKGAKKKTKEAATARSSSKRSRDDEDDGEPSEEAFLAAQKRLKSRQGAKQK